MLVFCFGSFVDQSLTEQMPNQTISDYFRYLTANCFNKQEKLWQPNVQWNSPIWQPVMAGCVTSGKGWISECFMSKLKWDKLLHEVACEIVQICFSWTTNGVH